MANVRSADEVEELGRQWDAGLASGDSVDGEQAFERIRARLDANLTAQNQQ